MKIQEQLEQERIRNKGLQQDFDIVMKEKEDLKQQNNSLTEELERTGRRDKKKKKAGHHLDAPSGVDKSAVQGYYKSDFDKQPSYIGSTIEGYKSSYV